MSDETLNRIVTGVLQRSVNTLGMQEPMDVYKLMVLFIHNAAHIAKQVTDADTICHYLNILREHLPECDGHMEVERHPGADPTIPTNTTKH